jgi:hypothetical protein
MHGLITILPLKNGVTVTGRLNWTSSGLVLFLSVMTIIEVQNYIGLIFVGILFLIITSSYLIQVGIYRRIVEILRDKGQLANA